jgi:hypothetical protein
VYDGRKEVSMKKLLVPALACALLVPASATAKERIGDARVVYTPAPSGLRAGQAWNVRFRFFFRSGRPWRISGLSARVTVRNALTGAVRAFGVAQDDSTYYSSRIRFPAAGKWTLTLHFGTSTPAGTRRLATIRVS